MMSVVTRIKPVTAVTVTQFKKSIRYFTREISIRFVFIWSLPEYNT